MKKLLFTLLLGISFLTPTTSSFGQEYEDLLVLLVDEDYEKCFDKAIKYTEKEDTKNDPLPYLYAAQALFEMSRDHKYVETFPNAYKDALSFAGKYRKQDKAYAYRSDAEPFIEKLKTIILEEIDNFLLDADEKAYKKALGLMKKVVKFDPDCAGSVLLWGELEILTKNKTEGKKIVVEGFKLIDKIGTDIQFGDMTQSQQLYLKYSLMFSAKLVLERDLARAREIISIGQPYFGEERDDLLLEDTSDFKKLYKEITG